MTKLTGSTKSKFLDRFYSFNDAVLREIKIAYLLNGKRNISVVIATRDAEQTENDGWVCVRLAISQVEDFSFSDSRKSSAQVLSQGVHICCFEESIGVDFGHFVDEPDNRAELESSKFFAIGSGIEWTVEPYLTE
jgi:hypothetical protein